MKKDIWIYLVKANTASFLCYRWCYCWQVRGIVGKGSLAANKNVLITVTSETLVRDDTLNIICLLIGLAPPS